MKSLKQQFKDFKTNTPKHIQWILLGTAFVVVIILLVLLLGHKSNNVSADNMNENVSFEVEPKTINLTNVEVGSSSSESINVSVSAPVVIKDIDVDVNGITTTDTCDNLTDVCIINVTYRPTSVQKESETTLKINWYIESQSEIVKTAEVSVKYSSWKKEEKKVEPVIEKKPAFIEEIEVIEEEPEIIEEIIEEEEDDIEDVIDYEPEPVIKKAAKEIKNIAVKNPLKEEPEFVLPPEKCSEFAIPGYDQSGRQIGWIKPERGANYFHPFSDKDCSDPTGRYDIKTGVITSLKDGSKIGTDSDHIGYRNVRTRNLNVPQLSSPKMGVSPAKDGTFGENAVWLTGGPNGDIGNGTSGKLIGSWDDWGATKEIDKEALKGSGFGSESIVSSRPYDRTFILRQFKPIPATIVSEVRADPSVYGCDKSGQNCNKDKNYSIPVRATVDRNVYSDDGRTIILPTGTLLMGYLSGELPGPYQAFGRMNIKWYQFIRPDGVEFNFESPDQDPYSADAQGRMGVPGHGSTDYVEQMVMPILTALVPAAVNMIAPITDTVINQIDLDNNTIVQSGTIRSSEMAKQDIINTWNKITQKLLVDAIDNTVPPFSIAAGTRINVYSPVDLIVTCDENENAGKKCAFTTYAEASRRTWSSLKEVNFVENNDPSWKGQIRSFNLNQYCAADSNGKITIDKDANWAESGYDYRTILAYCESQNYQAKNNAKQNAYNASVQAQSQKKQETYGSMTWDKENGLVYTGDEEQTKAYNQDILGLTYDENDNIINPWEKQNNAVVEEALTCDDGNAPDANGCCAGETYTDMGEAGFNCCPDTGGDCFPPIEVN